MTQLPVFKDGLPLFSGDEPALSCGGIAACMDVPDTMPTTASITVSTFNTSAPHCTNSFCSDVSKTYILSGGGTSPGKDFEWTMTIPRLACTRPGFFGYVEHVSFTWHCTRYNNRWGIGTAVNFGSFGGGGIKLVFSKIYFLPIAGNLLSGTIPNDSDPGDPCIGGACVFAIG